MTSKVYPPEITTEYVTATLNRSNSSSGCHFNTGSTVSDSVSLCKRNDIRRATGFETPNWRKIRNSGALLPFTPWSRFSMTSSASLGLREWCDGSNSRRHRWDNFYVSALPAIQSLDEGFFDAMLPDLDLEYYVQQAAAAIYSSGWDAATFLAEISQLRRMLSGVGKKIDNLSQGRRPDELYNLWLEGRYGWRTLMYDIRDLHEVLSQANERRSRYREQKGASLSGTYYDSSVVTSSNLVHLDEVSVSWSVNVRGTVVSDIEVPDFQFNPVTTAWEVTRLSFVVDWLLNVGQALEAASFLLKSKHHVAGGGFRADFSLTGTRTHQSANFGRVVYNNTGNWQAEATLIERVPMTVSALPRMKLRLDEYKIIDLIALVAQRLR